MKYRRRKKPREPVDESHRKAATDGVAAFLSHKSKRTPITGSAGTPTLKPIEVAVDEAERRSKSGEWDDAKPRAFVGLFALCHRIVYGDIPLELFEKREFVIAARMAGKALHGLFDDNVAAFVEFIKWSWEREKRRDAWALREGKDRNRMRARWQFSAAYVQDWRVVMTKAKRRGRYR